ncbi:MAG: hypothetical protein JWN76_1956 [Chitinophagaceae bacterium]|nr:hypothetical protein [Chitinophagaceae bacterium]
MNKFAILKAILCIAFIFLYLCGFSQSVAVGSIQDDNFRFMQLKGGISKNISLTVKPVFNSDTSENISNNKELGFKLLPLAIWNKLNSHHPYGWNDRGMIAASGSQGLISTGLYAEAGPLSAQLQPEFVFSQDAAYEHNSLYGIGINKPYHKLFTGQSAIRLNQWSLSLGVSTENLWWGPGQYSALLMSNNAPGFSHLTFNSIKPLSTPIGSFEFELIGGKLLQDSSRPFENFHLKPGTASKDWRYVNGIAFTYQPKWLEGLFVGFTRAFQLYSLDINKETGFINKYLPVFTNLFKKNTSNEDVKGRDQQLSFFTRWLFQKTHAEFYFEFGLNDHSYNSRDFLLDPEHSAAFITGFKKLLACGKGWLEFNAELTQMAQTPDYLVREAGNWYEHSQITQGYTHLNQVLGAGSGMGNNVQTFDVSWRKDDKKLGFQFQRIQQDPRGGDNSLPVLTRKTKWTDIAFGIPAQWRFDKLLLKSDMQFVRSKNYAWQQGVNRFNFYWLLKLEYAW